MDTLLGTRRKSVPSPAAPLTSASIAASPAEAIRQMARTVRAARSQAEATPKIVSEVTSVI